MPTDLLGELGFDRNEPGVAAAIEDAEALATLIESLVELRCELKLRQSDVADRLGIVQSAVSDFERLGGDPRLSTIQRYARALGASIEVNLRREAQNDSEWAPAGDTGVMTTWTPVVGVSTRHAGDDLALAS